MRKGMIWGLGVLVALLGTITAIVYVASKPALHGAVINPPLPAADFQLTDSHGKPFKLGDVRGYPSLLYFGYTNCTNECPLTMAHLKLGVDLLENKAAGVRVIMISTDPARDSSEAMRDFLGKFDSGFIGVTGTQEQLRTVWAAYGVTVEDGGETHSNYVYVVDKAGNLRETFLPDTPPADTAADLSLLMQE